MKRSEARILTTHAGSLPRTPELLKLVAGASRGEAVDAAALEAAIETSTRRVIEQQLAAGLDVGNDGEQSRESFVTYVRGRLRGFGGSAPRKPMRDLVAFPGYLEHQLGRITRPSVNLLHTPAATSAVSYQDRVPLEADLARFERLGARRFHETFWTVPSPGIVCTAMGNQHYATLLDYVDAVADALRVEYEAAVAAGHVLQVDAPDLAMERHTLFADAPLAEFVAFARHVVAALNRALANVPRERVRLHVCWGNYEGPHTHDVPFEELAEVLYGAHAGGLVLSMANPRHAHEHKVLKRLPPPADWALIAGVIDVTTNYVEHAEVVADRIELAAQALGDPHRVLAGTDCGFDTSAGLGQVADALVWEKLRALRDGAALATKRLL
ncbi:MAG TPA: cobalamin-independent methionine synthase II family protein [Myxococcota bacterium]|nr:cobalamin-independent methionine synthase II family protein [Myxococcota bacterium]